MIMPALAGPDFPSRLPRLLGWVNGRQGVTVLKAKPQARRHAVGALPEHEVIRWIQNVPDWDGRLPTVLVAAGAREQRRNLLRSLVAKAIEIGPALVEIAHPKNRPPAITRPVGSGLTVSSAGRGDLSALGLARSPLGVDLELVEPSGEIPWRVLHPGEVAFLARLHGEAQARAFARLWSLKEAYSKALRLGLAREPTSFGVRFLDEETAAIDDPVEQGAVIDARTAWRPVGADWTAVSAVVLDSVPRRVGRQDV